MALTDPLWACSDDHFLVSDNMFHLCSGFHAHRGGSPQKKGYTGKVVTQAMREDEWLMNVVKEFMRNMI